MVYKATTREGKRTKQETFFASFESLIYSFVIVVIVLSFTNIIVNPWVILPLLAPTLMVFFVHPYLGIYHMNLGINLRQDGKMAYQVTDKEIQVLFNGKIRKRYDCSKISVVKMVEELKGAKAYRYGSTYYFTENTSADDFPTVHIMATSLKNGIAFKYGYEWVYLSPEDPTAVKKALIS